MACAMTAAQTRPLNRRTAHMFYGFMRWLKVPLIPDHADYRLVTRPVLEALDEIKEHSLFLRGLFRHGLYKRAGLLCAPKP